MKNRSRDVMYSFRSKSTTCILPIYHLRDCGNLAIMKNLILILITENMCVDDLTCIDFSLTNSPVVNEDFVATALKVTINVHEHINATVHTVTHAQVYYICKYITYTH